MGRPSWAMWVGPDVDWMISAACRDEEPSLFFPHGNSSAESNPAKQVCAACSVRAECLAYAIESGMDEGVWGGLTGGERRKLRRGTATIDQLQETGNDAQDS